MTIKVITITVRFFAVLFALSLAGCLNVVETPDGRIPRNLLEVTSPLQGKYRAFIDSSHQKSVFHPDLRQGEVELQIKPDGQVALTSTVDLVGPDCGSTIGQLLRVGVAPDQPHLWEDYVADFELNPGRCKVIQNILSLHVSPNGAVYLSYASQFFKGSSGRIGPTNTTRYQRWTLERQ